MHKLLVIKADTNDADYIEASNKVTDKTLEQLRPVFDAIKNKSKKPRRGYASYHNWDTSEYRHDDCESPEQMYSDVLTEEQIELMNEYVPHGEYGIHTIKSIHIITVSDEEKVL